MLSTLTKKNLSIKKLSDHHQVAKLCFQISKKAKILVKYAARVRKALETIFKRRRIQLWLRKQIILDPVRLRSNLFFKKTEPKFDIKKNYQEQWIRTRSPRILSQVLNLSAKRAVVNRRNFLVYKLYDITLFALFLSHF